jgi:hypothetical protein
MRRVVLILAAAVTAATTAACGGGEVVVTAQLEGEATGTQEAQGVILGSLPIRLVPFDRDVVFDSLAQAYPEPEPQIPDSIVDLQDRVIERQREWQLAENEWAQLRDSLQALADTLQIMDQGSGEYFALFQEFGSLEGRVNRLQTQSEAAFQEFTDLQARLNNQSQEIEAARRTWADDAFSPVDSIFGVRLEEADREMYFDTTNAQGVAGPIELPAGEWWVTARYDRQFDELYWNERIEVPGGETVQVRLTEENAEARPKM